MFSGLECFSKIIAARTWPTVVAVYHRGSRLRRLGADCLAVLLSLALVLDLELSSRTNFESLALALALKVKSLALRVLGLDLGLEQKSLALAKQGLGLAGLVICQTNNIATMLKSTFIA